MRNKIFTLGSKNYEKLIFSIQNYYKTNVKQYFIYLNNFIRIQTLKTTENISYKLF
jgi:hypothetical protein